MERLVLFALACVLSSQGAARLSTAGNRDSGVSSLHRAEVLDAVDYSIEGPYVLKSRTNRKARSIPRRDLFGFIEPQEGFSSYEYVPQSEPYYSASSVTGKITPFWSFRTNSDFIHSSYHNDARTRPRRRTAYVWHRPWTRSSQSEDIMEAAGTESIKDEADPEPPQRDEEFVSEHEKPRDVPTRPKYGVPGSWAKGDVPGKKKVDIGFVPVQIYTQTRRYDSEQHLPRERAVEEAENEEELIAAPRLREVLRNKKVQQVYEEEGYEDLGYDHGGYNHHGVKVEDAVRNEHGAYRKKPLSETDSDPKGSLTIRVYSPDEEETTQADEESIGTGNGKERKDNYPEEPTNLEVSTPKVEVFRGKVVVDGRRGPSIRNSIKETVKQNLTIYVPENSDDISDRMDIEESKPEGQAESQVVGKRGNKITFPGKSTRRHYTSLVNPIVVTPDVYLEETASVQKPQVVHQVATYVPSPFYHESSPQSAQFSSATPMQLATINTYASLINQNFSTPLLHNPVTVDLHQPRQNLTEEHQWAPSSFHEKNVKSQVPEGTFKTDPSNNIKEKMDIDDLRKYHQTESNNDSIRKQNVRQPARRRGNTRSSNRNRNVETEAEASASTDSSHQLKTSTNRESLTSLPPKRNKVYSNFTRGSVKYNPEDESQIAPTAGTLNIRHPSLPVDTSEDKGDSLVKLSSETPAPTQIPSHTQRSSLIINIPSSIEPMGFRDSSANAKYVEQLTLAHFSAPVNISPQQTHLNTHDERLKELARQLNSPQEEEEGSQNTQHRRNKRSTIEYSKEKYPHYEAPPSISRDSALKYATNPAMIPKKTYGGMEFYESKENVRCDEPQPPRKVTPEKDKDGEWEEEPMPDGPRVDGVGSAINCFKKKYFGKDPFDNPFFKEGEVETHGNSYETRALQDEIPFARSARDSGNRKIMIIENKSLFKINDNDNDPASENGRRSITYDEENYESRESNEESESDEVSITTSIPPMYSGHQYAVQESTEEPTTTTVLPPLKQNHYNSLPNQSKMPLKKKKKLTKYVKQPISVYSIISSNSIPPHHAPLLIPETSPKHIPIPLMKNPIETQSPNGVKISIAPKVYAHSPQYAEKKIIITKREVEGDLWDIINPLKWWLPSLFDRRRDEPRYRRSTEDAPLDVVPALDKKETSSEAEVAAELSDVKPSTRAPMSLAEFKVKFNIPEPKSDISKKVTTRLTGGFINRNPDITDAIESLAGEPTEASTSSTVATTTSKPKVIFPRAKLPRRKLYQTAPKKSGNIPDTTTESTTTTTTTTLPPPTTTRMYKPKRVIKKNYGKGPFDAFTILKNQRDVQMTQMPPESTESPEISKRSDNSENQHKDIQQTENSRISKEDIMKAGYISSESVRDMKMDTADFSNENGTLTYAVNPATGMGTWGGEQRKWKPKRKRPNTPSIYSLKAAERLKKKKENASKKTERDVHTGNREVYLTMLMSRLSPSGPSREENPSDDYPKQRSLQVTEAQPMPEVIRTPPTRANSKPPPKYILEPDKRRYYYAKVR